jgi:hypothetical protein
MLLPVSLWQFLPHNCFFDLGHILARRRGNEKGVRLRSVKKDPKKKPRGQAGLSLPTISEAP